MEKLKSFKKEQILLLLLCGILLLVVVVPTEPADRTEQQVQTEKEQELTVKEEAGRLEEKLAGMLSRAQGVGKAEVMLTLKSDGKQIVEKDVELQQQEENRQEENAANQSAQTDHSETTVYQRDSGGTETPFVSEQLAAQIEGVLVLAQGGGSPETVNEITEAVMALFGVEAHKIKVMKME